MQSILGRVIGALLAIILAATIFDVALAAVNVSTCDTYDEEACHVTKGVTILKIDLMAPIYDFEMVMANDATTAHGKQRDYVDAMVNHSHYRARQPILAINADYFGDGATAADSHSSKGLTVKNGVRIPNARKNNNDEFWHSSFSLGSDRSVRIGRQTGCTSSDPFGCENWVPDAGRYEQTFVGGPLLIENGRAIQRYAGDTRPCTNERLATRYCREPVRWTAIGVSTDGKTLIVAVSSRNKTMWEMTSILRAEGAWRAMKLDGASSSQLWYRGESLVSDQPIANALLVFASPDNCDPFGGVRLDNPFRCEIKFLKDIGIFKGFSDGLYHPVRTFTRAEMATTLWKWIKRKPPDFSSKSNPNKSAQSVQSAFYLWAVTTDCLPLDPALPTTATGP